MSLSNYKIIEELGGCKHIRKAMDLINNRQVVIKKIRSDSDSIREVEYHQKLSHLSFIPTLYEVFAENEYTYIVMELINNQSLCRSWIENNNNDYYWMTTLHAIQAIQELHEAGFCHGDLHLGNLHLGNLIWTGEKMYMIDCNEVTEYVVRYETMITIDYNCDILEQYKINNRIRNDYDNIINYKWIDDNMNGDCKRYELLVDFYQDEYVPDSKYIRRVIEEYHRIDKMIF